MNKKVFIALGMVSALALTATTYAAQASTTTGNFTIALSNSYIGNSWRTQMVKSFAQAAESAKAHGEIANYEVVNANNTASQQISQINDMILKHVSAIVLDSASTTALNGVIAKAHAAGIPVISFDSVVTSSTAYDVNYDYVAMGQDEANYLVQRLHGKGNVLISRGIAGTSVDNDFYKGEMDVFNKHKGIKVVNQVYSNWTETTAQSVVAALLPSLPQIDGVATEGGDGYGIAQAFAAVGKKEPIIIMGNRGVELHWWAQQHKKNGDPTMSVSSSPTVGGASLWVALAVLQHLKVPQSVTMPGVKITQSTLKKWLSLGDNDVAGPTYNYTWVKQHLLTQK